MTVHDDSLLPMDFSSTNYEVGILGVMLTNLSQNITQTHCIGNANKEGGIKITNVYVRGKKPSILNQF